MLLLVIFEVASTFAKYTSEAEATAEATAGAWVIKINNENLSNQNNTIKNFSINSLTYTSNQYVLQNKIAPSTSGYFEIEFDPTGTSVAVRFDVTINLAALNISDSIDFKNATVTKANQEPVALIRTGENTYTGTISLSEVKSGVKPVAKFYIEWEDDLTGTNDEADSRLGVDRQVNGTLALPVTVAVSQYSGETIVQYVDE